MTVFRAVQVETAHPLGPPDGRYLKRPVAEAPPSHVLVFAGVRTTVVDVSTPLADPAAAKDWLKRAGEPQLAEGLAVLETALHAFRLIVADPYVLGPGRRQLLVARIGYGPGPDLSEGRLGEHRELDLPRGPRFQRRSKVLEPQARLAAALSGREPPLVCAELALRAGFDQDQGRGREAALGTLVALNAAIAELSVDARAGDLTARVQELRELVPGVSAAGQTALSSALDAAEAAAVEHALSRLEAALRARAVAHA